MFIVIKISLLLIPFFFSQHNTISNLSETSCNDKIVKMEKKAILQLKTGEINHLKKTAVWKYLLQEGNQIRSKSGVYILSGKLSNGGTLTMVVNDQPNDKSAIDLDITPYFQIMWENLNYILYCSCGTNVMGGAGDGCFAYQTGRGPQCGGQCTDGFNGQTCSFTLLNLSNGHANSMF
jgi:hypothetical protein